MVKRAACRWCPFSSSVMATPFSTSTTARRAAQMLMGSYEAFSTSTGVCIGLKPLPPWPLPPPPFEGTPGFTAGFGLCA